LLILRSRTLPILNQTILKTPENFRYRKVAVNQLRCAPQILFLDH
jgi:hypothetical protein